MVAGTLRILHWDVLLHVSGDDGVIIAVVVILILDCGSSFGKPGTELC